IRDELNQRIVTIAADTDAITGAIEREIEQGADPRDRSALLARPRVAGLIAALKTEWPGLLVLPSAAQNLLQTAGKNNASGVDNFRGLVEYRNRLSFAAAQSRDLSQGSINLLVVAPLNSSTLDRFAPELGPIQLTLLTPASESSPERQVVLGKYVAGQIISSRNRTLPPAAHWFDFPVHGLSTFEAIHVERGASGGSPAPVLVAFSLRSFAVSRNLLSSVGDIGPRLVEIIIAVAAVFLAIEIIALITGIILTRTITGAVADLYEATLRVRRGDFTYRVHRKHRDQLAALGDSFNEMTASISELIEDQRQHQRLENEVSIAREVQRQLFPRELPSVPGLQLAAICS